MKPLGQPKVIFVTSTMIGSGEDHRTKVFSARYLNHPFKTSHEVAFFYDGQTLPRGTILWRPTNQGSTAAYSDAIYRMSSLRYFPAATLILGMALIGVLRRHLRNRHTSAFP